MSGKLDIAGTSILKGKKTALTDKWWHFNSTVNKMEEKWVPNFLCCWTV